MSTLISLPVIFDPWLSVAGYDPETVTGKAAPVAGTSYLIFNNIIHSQGSWLYTDFLIP